MDFNGKHIILGYGNHVFTNLFIDVLINNRIVKDDKIVLLTLDDKENHFLSENIEIIISYYKKHSIADISKAKTFTIISLNKYNSFIVKELYSYSSDNINKTYVYLTDDELYRWKIVKNIDGRINSNNKKYSIIGEADVEILPYIKNFISSEKSFREPLEEVLERKDFFILDARDPFATMPVRLTHELNKILELDSIHTAVEKKILLGSKRGCFSFKEIISLFKELKKRALLKKYKFILFTDPKRRGLRICLDLYCLYLRRINNIVVDVCYPTISNSLTYTNLIMSCSYFILQGRGGMSSARSYARAGRGVICVKSGTPNERELVDSLGLAVISYKSLGDLANKMATCNIDIASNKIKMAADLENSFANLRSVYC